VLFRDAVERPVALDRRLQVVDERAAERLFEGRQHKRHALRPEERARGGRFFYTAHHFLKTSLRCRPPATFI
jgi:hypothetical protein